MELKTVKKQLKKNGGGFTLVEVIVVLVILAILAAIAVPALTGYIDKANERKILSDAKIVAFTYIDGDGKGFTYNYNIDLNAGTVTFDESAGYRVIPEA